MHRIKATLLYVHGMVFALLPQRQGYQVTIYTRQRTHVRAGLPPVRCVGGDDRIPGMIVVGEIAAVNEDGVGADTVEHGEPVMGVA